MNNNVKIISKESLNAEADKKISDGFLPKHSDMCGIVTPTMGSKYRTMDNAEKWTAMDAAQIVGTKNLRMSEKIKTYGSAADVPRYCATLKKEMSVRDMVSAGLFKPNSASMSASSSNTLVPDWASLWDALRIDISIRKAARGVVRDSFYNIIDMPNSSKTFNATEFFPYNIVFKENNGEGQAVPMGETRAGQYESMEHIIYAAGFSYTLLAALFDESLDMGKLADAVSIGYNAKRDDLAITPILDFSYSGAQQTAAATTGTDRQEKLHATIGDGVDDLSERDDPITDRKIVASDLAILASPLDAMHIARVINGLPSVNERNLPSISEVTSVVAYDGETIRGRVSDTTYAGVTNGTAYLIKKNRYNNIGIKRNLQLEVDMQPNVLTLSQEERAWYFAEAMQTTGNQYFIQELTLPTF